MKLVVDTNLLISGTLWDGPPARLIDSIESGLATLCLSPDMLAEFSDVIRRPKLLARLTQRNTTPEQLVLRLAREAVLIQPAILELPAALRDPKDLPVLAAAVGGAVDAIISGEKDLLTLGSFHGIPILEVTELLRRF